MYLVALLTSISVSMNLTAKYGGKQNYIKVSVVFMVELLKCIAAFFMLYKEEEFSMRRFLHTIKQNTIDQPWQFLMKAVPAFLFFLQSQLLLYANGSIPIVIQQVSQTSESNIRVKHQSQTSESNSRVKQMYKANIRVKQMYKANIRVKQMVKENIKIKQITFSMIFLSVHTTVGMNSLKSLHL